ETPLMPSQRPPQTPVPAQAGRPDRDKPVTGAHVPTEPASPQASQVPSQARSQQTLSMQKPLAHWVSPLQGAPSTCRGTHTPAEQKVRSVRQSASIAQSPLQVVPPGTQPKPPQSCCWKGAQEPLPWQVPSRTATPPEHRASRQTV